MQEASNSQYDLKEGEQKKADIDYDSVPTGFSISRFAFLYLGARDLTKIIHGYRDRAKTPLGDITILGEMGGKVIS
jgi:hypothetical protein